MSEYIPLELQQEILKRLPVKPLIQFRSVSKAWKSLIDSSDFIAAHSVRHIQPPRLLVRYDDPAEFNEDPTGIKVNYVSFVDDETFPQQSFVPPLPLHIDQLSSPRSVGSSHGLLCFDGYYLDSRNYMEKRNVVVWNPSIRKSIAIPVPYEFFGDLYTTISGFGVSPVTYDPKIVLISCFDSWSPKDDMPWIVKVYTLSSREWRSLSTNQLPRGSIYVEDNQVTTDRFIYWLACDHMIYHDAAFRGYNLIISFDIITEEFGEVNLPDVLVRGPDLSTKLTINKVLDTLALLEYNEGLNNERMVCDVWKMEDGIQKSFSKLFTINLPNAWIPRVLGFRNNGEPIMETNHHDTESVPLVVYKPYSEQVIDVGINRTYGPFIVCSYMETLLLLNH